MSTDDRVARLRDQASKDYPRAWSREEEPEVVGFFVRLEEGKTAFGPAKIVILADAATGEERSVWLLHHVLRGEFAKLRPAVGELVLVRYLGKRTPDGGGQDYEAFRVLVDREPSPAAWNELAAEAAGEAGAQAPQAAPLGAATVEPSSSQDDIPF